MKPLVIAGRHIVLLVAAFMATAAVAQEASPLDIMYIQRALVRQGYKVGSLDGIWGRRSAEALAAFQRAQGLPATGELDHVTISRLLQPRQAKQPSTPAAGSAQVQDDVSSPKFETLPSSPPPFADAAGSAAGAASVPPTTNAAISAPRNPVKDTSPEATASSWRGSGWLIGIVAGFGIIGLLARRRKERMRAGSKQRINASDAAWPDGSRNELPGAEPAAPMTNVAPVVSDALKSSLAIHNSNVGRVIENAGLPVRSAQVPSENEGASLSESEVAAPMAVANIPTNAVQEPLAADDANVAQAVDCPSLPSESAAPLSGSSAVPLQELPTSQAGARSALGDEFKAELSAHNAKVARIIGERDDGMSPGVQLRSSLVGLIGGTRRDAPAEADGWIPVGQPVRVGTRLISGGMIYVGRRLPQQGNGHQVENCLINPDLAVAVRNGDPHGDTMGYWPSYSAISAEARKSYLDWLAGSRSEPEAYIGYVFLYFYGLERRLMLEGAAVDAEAVIKEVRRLLDVYGAHHSFRRYAQELLSAHEMRQAEPPKTIIPDVELGGYEVPLHIKAALGVRVRDGQPIEPDLLLAYVVSHPETNVRTPAKRAVSELRELFAEAVARAHPKGVRVPLGRARMLKATYHACSGTFEVDIRPYGGDLPDITGRSKPLDIGRDIFNACVDQLDDYSRALGRLPGMTPNLAAIARLPVGFRRRRAELLAGQPLSRIEALAQGGTPLPVEQLAGLVGLEDGPTFGRAKLRDLAAILASFGYGTTADPAFSMRTTKLGEAVVVFPLGAEAEAALLPSAGYRKVQATIMLGMLVASADGTFDESERRGLVARIEGATTLSVDERRRLQAELSANEHTPGRMADWMKLLKDMEATDSSWVADVLVGAAAADGRIDAQEVTMLEKLFRRLGLDEASLYGRLHGGLAGQAQGRDDDLQLVVPPGNPGTGSAIPRPPSHGETDGSRMRVNLSKLEAIRRETRSAAGVLADIFAEEEEAPDVPQLDMAPEEDGEAMFEGLERRYGSLLAELSEREEWTAADFEQLARNAGLMPRAVCQALNDWALDRFDELLIEGEDPIIISRHLLPLPGDTAAISSSADSRAPA